MADIPVAKDLLADAISAIEAGDLETAIRCVKALNETALQVHDRMVYYINLLLSFVAEEMGEDRVRDAWRYVIERVHKKGMLALKGKPREAVRQMFESEHAAHGSRFSTLEYKDRTQVTIHCCGSGGRLRRDHPENEGTFAKARPWAFGKKGISYYCSHCAIVGDESPDWDADFSIHIQYGKQFDEDGRLADDPCLFQIRYKNDS